MKKSSKQSLGITILKWKMTKITRYIELVEPAPRHKWDEQSQRVRVKMNKYCRANNYTPFLSLALSLSHSLFNIKAPYYVQSHSINYPSNLLQV